MVKKLKMFIKKLIYPNYHSNEVYVNYLRSKGREIGERTYFYDIMSRRVDETCIAHVKIGDDCRITAGAYILAHDYSYAVLRQTHHKMLCKTSKTTIGNNVIVAAGSVVIETFQDNVVIGGNPAKIICSFDEYYKFR